MLFSPDFSLEFQGGFIQLQVSISRQRGAGVAQSLRFLRGHWLESSGNRKILMQCGKGIHSRKGRSNGQTHGVAQCFLRLHLALNQGAGIATKTLHSNGRDPRLISTGSTCFSKLR